MNKEISKLQKFTEDKNMRIKFKIHHSILHSKFQIQNSSGNGLTLIEIIIYVGIFAVVGGLMTAILLNATRVEEREVAGAEITSQLNFVTQTIQRLIRESSYIDVSAGVSTSTLKLRMADSSSDPTFITLADGVIKLQEGANATTSLTNDKVIVNSLDFKKFTQYPGHDTVSFSIAMSFASQSPSSQAQRIINSAVIRASAATFDFDVVPGSSNNNLGQSTAPWQNVYLSGVLNIGTAATNPPGQNGSLYYNTTDDVFRGYSNGVWINLGGSGSWTVSGNNIYNTNSGNVGIGTTGPSSKLTVDTGAIRFTGAPSFGAGTDAGVWGAGAAQGGYLGLIADGSEVVRIDGGNVGIGTTNPTTKLYVVGKATFTGGVDPPYMSFSNESHESIREFAKEVAGHEKVMLFWNGQNHRLEVYVIAENRFYTLTGELIVE